ncbi:hypothetical protein PDO_4912, partial [Rhizobium sp. PDO1-076]
MNAPTPQPATVSGRTVSKWSIDGISFPSIAGRKNMFDPNSPKDPPKGTASQKTQVVGLGTKKFKSFAAHFDRSSVSKPKVDAGDNSLG